MKYNVIKINNYVHSAIKTLKVASTTGGTITDQEIYAPVEWATHMLFIEAQVASTPTYIPDTLFNEAQSKYTTLLNQGRWCP